MRSGGDPTLALAAYNAGERAVMASGRAVPPYRETRDYVRKVLEAYAGRCGSPPARRIIQYLRFRL